MSRKSRRAIAVACCEPLEYRRLLTTTINETNGNDTLTITDSGFAPETVAINGVDTHDVNVVINLLDGNDTVFVNEVAQGASITINGGNGDDHVQAADGSMQDDLDGDVHFDGGAGNNSLVLADDGGGNHRTNDVTTSHIFDEYSGTGAFFSNVQSVSLFEGDANDTVDLDSFPSTATTIDLGGGTNTVHWGAALHQVTAAFFPCTIVGNSSGNNDTLLVDDSNPQIADKEYDLGPTSVMGVSISGINRVHIESNPEPGARNVLYFGGFPAPNITVDGVSNSTVTTIGSSASPLDLNNSNENLTLNVPGTYSFYDQETDNSNTNTPFALYRDGSSTAQWLSKGTFACEMTASDPYFLVYGGTGNNTFDVAGMCSGAFAYLYGGSGNDTLQTYNRDGANNTANDLDAVFTDDAFNFDGGGGTNTVILSDSADQIGDGDSAYYIGAGSFAKGSDINHSTAMVTYANVQILNLATDDDANSVALAYSPSQTLTLNTNAGNDTIYDYSGSGLQNIGSLNLTGGPGIDTLQLEDTYSSFTNVSEYDFGVGTISYHLGGSSAVAATITYDSTLENIICDENNGNTTTRVNGKLSGTGLSVNAGSGNNTFFVGGGDIDSDGFVTANSGITGGGGTDSVEFQDQSDNDSSLESDTYTWNSTSIAKGSAGLTYSGFESQILDVSTFTHPLQFTAANIVNLNSTASGMGATTIVGGARSTTVNIGNGLISAINGLLTVNLGTGSNDVVNLNDQNSAVADGYLLYSSQFAKSSWIVPYTFSGVDAITLNASTADNIISVGTVTTGDTMTINADDGNDSIYLGSGNIHSDLGGPVSVNGGNGTDTLYFANSSASSPESESMTASTFTDGATHSFSNIEAVHVQSGRAGGTISLNSVAVATTIDGNATSGNDNVIIGGGNLDANLLASVTVNGNAGTDSVTMDDSADTGNDSYDFAANLSANTVFHKLNTPGVTVTFSSVELASLSCNSGNNAITVESGTMPLSIFGNAGADSLTVQAGTVTFDGGTGLNSIDATAATVHLTTSQTLSSLSIHAGATVMLDQNGNNVVSATSLTIATNGKLDLTNNDFVLDYTGATPMGTVLGSISSARNNGAWNGATGLTTSTGAANSLHTTGIGTMEATQFKSIYGSSAKFDGLTIDNTAVLVKYTYNGDTNFSGKVDGGDYAQLDLSFGHEATQGNIAGWFNGDLDGNGRVDGGDYAIIDAAFTGQSGALGRSPALPPATSPTTSPATSPAASPANSLASSLLGQSQKSTGDGLPLLS